MSKMKIYDNGSIAGGGSTAIAPDKSYSFLMGRGNIAGKYVKTYDSSMPDSLMLIDGEYISYPSALFSSEGDADVFVNAAAGTIVLRFTASSATMLDNAEDSTIMINTGRTFTQDSYTYVEFKLVAGPVPTTAYGFFIRIDRDDRTDASMIVGVNNHVDKGNVVKAWDTTVIGKNNFVFEDHLKVDGNNNFIMGSFIMNYEFNQLTRTQPYFNSLNGSCNFLAELATSPTEGNREGSHNGVLGSGNWFTGDYNTILGTMNYVKSSFSYNLGAYNYLYGQHSTIIGDGMNGGSTTMPSYASRNYALSRHEVSIGTGIVNGIKGIRINSLSITQGSDTCAATFKDAFPNDNLMPASTIIWAFYYGSWSCLYGQITSRSASSTAPSANPFVYTVKLCSSTGTPNNATATVTHDFSSQDSPIFWHMAFPYSTPYLVEAGTVPIMGSVISTNLNAATHPLNNYQIDKQTYGLGNINIGHNIFNASSRSICIGNDLAPSMAMDKAILIGNGTGVPTSGYLSYIQPYLSAYDDGDAAMGYYARRVEIVNKFNKKSSATGYTGGNSSITMAHSGTSYVSASHSFSCNSVSSTGNRIALNAPLTLSSSYTYGTSLPTTYLQSGRIFFLI